MKFEEKISGTCVTDYNIIPIFENQYIWLTEAMEKIHRQEAMNYLLDTFRFTKGCEEKEDDWCAILDWDSIMKITVLNDYPAYEQELKEYFGENWLKRYIRFNH